MSNDFRKYKVHVDIRGGSPERGRQTTLGVVDDGDFCYVFENVRDTASNIIRRYATPCRPVTDCKMNDLE